MKHNITYSKKAISVKEFMLFHKPDEVLDYCKACSNYGKLWSCPPHSVDIQDFLAPYKEIWIIGAKLHIPPMAKLTDDDFLELFNKGRRLFGDMLFELEKKHKKSSILIAGNCYNCKDCTRPEGQECRFREHMRYSLESLGFHVSDIVREVLNDEIQWFTQERLPSYLLFIGALLV